MSIEEFRELIREEVEKAFVSYLRENRDIQQIKSDVIRTTTEHMAKNIKVKEMITNDIRFVKYQVMVDDKSLTPIVVLSPEGLKTMLQQQDERIKKRLDYLEKLIGP